MPDNEFVDRLVALIDQERVPTNAAVLRVRSADYGETERRLRTLVGACAEASGESWRQRDTVRTEHGVRMRLPGGATADAYMASGSLRVSRGLPPMEQLIGRDDSDESLTAGVVALRERVHLDEHIAQGETLSFEKLWRIKAAGMDRQNRVADPVLCRAVGAFRHVVRDMPVLGPASATVSVAAKGQLDKVEIQARHVQGGAIETVPVLPASEAANLVLKQLSTQLPGNERSFSDNARPVSFQFGYFAMGKRTAQAYLAPAYVAQVELHATDEEGKPDGRAGYVAVVAGSEKDYLQITRAGKAPRAGTRSNGGPPPTSSHPSHD